MDGKEPTPEMLDFPGVEDGVRGMQFIAVSYTHLDVYKRQE